MAGSFFFFFNALFLQPSVDWSHCNHLANNSLFYVCDNTFELTHGERHCYTSALVIHRICCVLRCFLRWFSKAYRGHKHITSNERAQKWVWEAHVRQMKLLMWCLNELRHLVELCTVQTLPIFFSSSFFCSCMPSFLRLVIWKTNLFNDFVFSNFNVPCYWIPVCDKYFVLVNDVQTVIHILIYKYSN